MECHEHNAVNAAGQCSDCRRGLCSECLQSWNPPLCGNCASVRIEADKQRFRKDLILAGVLLALGILSAGVPAAVLAGGEESLWYRFLVAYGIAMVPFGWRALSRLRPSPMIILLPFIGWVLYFVLKTTISAAAGIFIGPFYMYRAVRGFRTAAAISSMVKPQHTAA